LIQTRHPPFREYRIVQLVAYRVALYFDDPTKAALNLTFSIAISIQAEEMQQKYRALYALIMRGLALFNKIFRF
jgi:hypothetical protein